MAPTRPKGILLDIGDTLLREIGYGVADGVAALQPLGGRGEQLAIERIDLPASELWYIGANWDSDVAGASAAGLFPVWLKPLGDERGGVEHARARSWEDIASLFEAATG